jgi:hypothetical protein
MFLKFKYIFINKIRHKKFILRVKIKKITNKLKRVKNDKDFFIY